MAFNRTDASATVMALKFRVVSVRKRSSRFGGVVRDGAMSCLRQVLQEWISGSVVWADKKVYGKGWKGRGGARDHTFDCRETLREITHHDLGNLSTGAGGGMGCG